MSNDRLMDSIESARTELLDQLQQVGFNFRNVKVLQISRKLDCLLNLYHRKNYG